MTSFSTREFIPASIEIAGANDNTGSAVIINISGQGLFKSTKSNNYSVSNRLGINENNGDNYMLVKVDKPEPNRLYLAIFRDQEKYEDFSLSIDEIQNYFIYLEGETFCRWEEENGSNGYYNVVIEELVLNYFLFYEVIKNG